MFFAFFFIQNGDHLGEGRQFADGADMLKSGLDAFHVMMGFREGCSAQMRSV